MTSGEKTTLRVGCVVLAAGRSTRMGANKLAADLAGRPIIAHVVDATEAAGLGPPIVVLGSDADAIRKALSGRDVRFVLAHDYRQGLSRSLAAGIAVAPADWAAAIICLGDMPLISGDLLRAIAALASENAIVAPRFAGQRGNPLLWGRVFFARLEALAGDVGARTLLADYSDRLCHLDWGDDSVLVDVDRPDDLTMVERRLAGLAG